MAYVMHVDYIASEERGTTQNQWLKSKHTYSFGNYYNSKRVNFGTLRVFNDDFIDPAQGFPTHHHDNMEIITVVLDGILEHKDSKGNKGTIKFGDVQRMTAGTGIEHSEYNGSNKDKLHLLQIWVYPDSRNLEPGYEQKTFNPQQFKNTLYPVVTPVRNEGSVFIHQDATFYLGDFEENQAIKHVPKTKKHGDYIFVIGGSIQIGDKTLKTGDSVQVTKTDHIDIKTLTPSKILLIEVSMGTL